MIPTIRRTCFVFGDGAEGEEAASSGSTTVSASRRWCRALVVARVYYIGRCSLVSVACAKSLTNIHTESCRPAVNADTMSVSTSPLRCLVQWTTTLLVSKLALRFHAFVYPHASSLHPHYSRSSTGRQNDNILILCFISISQYKIKIKR